MTRINVRPIEETMRTIHPYPTDQRASSSSDESTFAEDARFYLQLTPRQLPSRFLYDPLGSSLFEAICYLPWYKITRAELRLLERHAGDIGRLLGSRARIVELGSGNGEKLATLVTHAGTAHVHAHLIDLSGAALARSQQVLTGVEGVEFDVTVHQATYEDGLLALPDADGERTVVAFLGSNIGNFDLPGAESFLQSIGGALQPGDYLLLGVDLVKPERELLLAYDDPLGLTAVFNKNLLLRVNTELEADFALDRFAHRAVWNGADSRVEMHLVSLAHQEVTVVRSQLRFTLQEGEAIWTESSYKYEPEQIVRLVHHAGFTLKEQWIEPDAGFALTLFEST
jgi:L-histidine Nalpha-methyltransferase